MTYIPSPTKDFSSFSYAGTHVGNEVVAPALKDAASPAEAGTKPRRGFFRAVFDAIWTARQRQADAEIARYLATTGGKLTDSAEREISRRLSGDNFRLR